MNKYKKPNLILLLKKLNKDEIDNMKEVNKDMLYKTSLDFETIVNRITDNYHSFYERKPLVYAKALDIPTENLEVYFESYSKEAPKLVAYDKEKNEKLFQVSVPDGYTHKVFYKEGVLVVRLDSKEPETYRVKIDV